MLVVGDLESFANRVVYLHRQKSHLMADVKSRDRQSDTFNRERNRYQ